MLHYWNFMVPFYIEYLGCDCKYRDSGISEGRYQQLFNLILMVISGYQMAASMHDIGKISTPDSILQKPGKLTAEEFEVMKLHTVNGAKIVRKSLARLGDAQYIDVVHDIVLYHHEKWNGAGYPEGIGSSFDPLIAEAFFGQ